MKLSVLRKCQVGSCVVGLERFVDLIDDLRVEEGRHVLQIGALQDELEAEDVATVLLGNLGEQDGSAPPVR